ncbi:PQQ-dependent sugar dehydrogenase [Amnibacterium setariae]|uniref:Gluconolaconase n=1 Tax=Amnibacterium setariae TaxID=2306585 RepID=A0A3A1TY41_9MICO|nr:gluconolaconase [Amnibacterium setariae]RIX27595.1 gluconolaconase [Amnibacterium setariae]
MTRPARPLAALLLAVGAAVLAGCTASPSSPAASPTPAPSGLVDSRLAVPSTGAAAPFDVPRTVQAPAGWRVALWARVDGARLAAWTPDGRLLVSRPESGDVQVLTPGKDGAPRVGTLVDGLNRPHGLAFDGDRLYVAESDRVDAYDYRDGAVSARRTIVDGLPDASTPELRGAYAHALKSVAVGEDGAVYVSVGSTGNTSAEDRSASPERAAILKVDGGRTTVFARGVRNGTGLAVAPDGSVWTAVNNRDRIAYPYDRSYEGGSGSDRGGVLQQYVNDHPLEPIARLTAGRDLGWPYCNPDPDVDPGAAGTAFDYSDRAFVRDEEANADGSRLDCAALPAVEQGLPAHSAPLGLSFVRAGVVPGGAGALVGIHGSWNRTPPRAPSVAFLPWRDGALQDAKTLLAGFQAADGSRWGRPVAAVAGPEGAVYVTDDEAGAVYRMAPPS